MTTDSQIKPIQRGSGAGGFEDPAGGCPGSKATVLHAWLPGVPVLGGNGERKIKKRRQDGSHLPQLTAVLS